MIYYHLHRTRVSTSNGYCRRYQGSVVRELVSSRNLFNVQRIEYHNLISVCSTDLDPTGNFLLVGLSNGTVDLQEILEPNYGTLDEIGKLTISPFSAHRVQWNPAGEQFFSVLDNHTLHLVDPDQLRTIDKFAFELKTNWSDWNPNDTKMIAVCGTESQTRLVDLRSGSAVHTIILAASSGLASHRASRCLWSKLDENCLIVGDNEGYMHLYDTRQSSKPLILAGAEYGQISGMSFVHGHKSIITTQGTENHLVQWDLDKCSLRPWPSKFKKRNTHQENAGEPVQPSGEGNSGGNSKSSSDKSNLKKENTNKKDSRKKLAKQRIIPLPVNAYLRCQFYLTDRHLFCPVPSKTRKSKEIYIYDLDSGDRIKTLKSDDVLAQGIYSVNGLLPEAMVLYVGGRGRLRVWTLDEDYQRKLDEKMKAYHKSNWDAD